MTDVDTVLDLDAAQNWSAIWRVNGAVRQADLIDELIAAVRGLREQRDRQDAVIRGQDAVIAGLRDVRIVMDPMGTTWRHYNDVGWTMTVCVRRGEAPQFQTRAELEQHVGPTLDVFIAPPIPSPVGVPIGDTEKPAVTVDETAREEAIDDSGRRYRNLEW